MAYPAKDIEQRFMEFVYMDPNSGCWIFFGATQGTGYGTFFIKKIARRPVKMTAHRASWMIFRGGEPAKGIDVCHKCPLRCCVNPDHLYLGDRMANLNDYCNKKETLSKLNKSGLPRGVQRHGKKFYASRYRQYLGTFSTVEEAQAAYLGAFELRGVRL